MTNLAGPVASGRKKDERLVERTVSGNYFSPVIVLGEGDSVWKEMDEYAYQCLFVCVDHARSEEGDVWFSFARAGGKLFFSPPPPRRQKKQGERRKIKNK